MSDEPCKFFAYTERRSTHWIAAIWRRSPGFDFNPLAPGRFQINFRYVIFKLTLVNGGWGISYEISLQETLLFDTTALIKKMSFFQPPLLFDPLLLFDTQEYTLEDTPNMNELTTNQHFV